MGLTLLGAGLPGLIPELKINPVPHYCGHLLASFLRKPYLLKLIFKLFSKFFYIFWWPINDIHTKM
jgi:hypothetical protein